MTAIPSGSAQTAVDPFTVTQRYYWRIALELRLRKANSDAFQDFFSTVMGLLHGDDFVRVRPYGALGDRGCDGYLQSNGQLFQCYGALAGELKQVATLTTKMTDDCAKALRNLAAIMKEWHMVHNIADGLPVEAVTTMDTLSKRFFRTICGRLPGRPEHLTRVAHRVGRAFVACDARPPPWTTLHRERCCQAMMPVDGGCCVRRSCALRLNRA